VLQVSALNVRLANVVLLQRLLELVLVRVQVLHRSVVPASNSFSECKNRL
jgi:hypothetical protein